MIVDVRSGGAVGDERVREAVGCGRWCYLSRRTRLVSLSDAIPSRPELQQVVGGADQRPLLLHPNQSATQELAEPTRVLDLPERRLGDRLAPRVHLPTTLRAQRALHLLLHRQGGRRSS